MRAQGTIEVATVKWERKEGSSVFARMVGELLVERLAPVFLFQVLLLL